jgi:bifunctional DNase/RNase
VIEVVVIGLGVAPPSTGPLLLLKELHGERVLPIGIGPLEAQAIVMPLQGVHPPRPMTHDVFVELIGDLGGHMLRVELTELADSVFHARLVVEQDHRERAIDIRPSDAIALAVRTETPIHVAESVMDQASVIPEPAADSDDQEASLVDESNNLSPFREFIETLEMDDLDPGGGEKHS